MPETDWAVASTSVVTLSIANKAWLYHLEPPATPGDAAEVPSALLRVADSALKLVGSSLAILLIGSSSLL